MKNFIPHHSWPVRIYWEDTDAGGVVYHSRYVNFLERARSEWLRSHNINQSQMTQTLKCALVVQRFDLKINKPCYLDDLLFITTQITSMKKASMVLDQRAHKEDNSTLILEGRFYLVCVRPDTFKPCRIPKEILAANPS